LFSYTTGVQLTYDAFAEKLRKVKEDFRKSTGKYPETIAELDKFLDRRLIKPKPGTQKAAKSLRMLFPGS
jgi:hypothetical protein